MREEEIKLVLYLPKNTSKKYRDIAETIGNIKINKNDTFELNYYFDIVYLGRVAERFKNILKLSKAGFLLKGDLKVLNQKFCLFKELLKEIEEESK